MKALIFENKVVDIVENEFGVAPAMKWMDAPEGCKTFWVLDGGNLVAPPTNYPPAIDELRRKRNQRLEETDWWSGSDLTMSADQTAYRKALRDLPSTSSPELDEHGIITGVTWPTKP